MSQKTSRYVIHRNDLPADIQLGSVLSIDSEFMGLNVLRDRLCLLQIYDGGQDSQVHMVQFDPGKYDAPNVRKILADASRQKLFFFARADMRWIQHYLGVQMDNIYCLRIASRIARTYTQSHDLEDVIRQILGVKISKEQQCTYWGAENLSEAQLDYACNDVLYLHALKNGLEKILSGEGRLQIALDLFKCLPAVVRADLAGWANEEIFAYQVPKLP